MINGEVVRSTHSLEGEALNEMLQCIPKSTIAITIVIAFATTRHVYIEVSYELLPECDDVQASRACVPPKPGGRCWLEAETDFNKANDLFAGDHIQ